MLELQRAHKDLEVLASTDALTCAANRREFTSSLGVAQLGINGDDFEAVLDAADTRMYQAKHEGRNKVVGE